MPVFLEFPGGGEYENTRMHLSDFPPTADSGDIPHSAHCIVYFSIIILNLSEYQAMIV
jgi:hypothetical protein